MGGQSFRFHTSLMTSSSSLCKPCTQLSTRAKLESLKVPLERCVFMLGHRVRPEIVALFCMICVFITCFGTQGKSLSLICGALSWLTDLEEKRRQETAALLQKGEVALSSAAQSSSSSTEPDWITDFVQKKAERDLVSKLKVKMSYFVSVGFLNLTFILHQDEELKRQKREERLEKIRGNVQLKHAMKRKVSNPA